MKLPVTLFVVVKPDMTLANALFPTQADAQAAIDAIEPDVLERNHYAIHPVHDTEDLKQFGAKVHGKIELRKFDGEYVGQAPVEVVERTF